MWVYDPKLYKTQVNEYSNHHLYMTEYLTVQPLLYKCT